MPERPANDDLTSAVARAGGCREALTALAALYADADGHLGDTACRGGGVCCRFDLAGHRLYASTLELAALLQEPASDTARAERLRCPWQRGPRCLARIWRPLGCRTFFCGGDAAAQAALYERLHQRIAALHAQFGLNYAYVELTAAWRMLLEPAISSPPEAELR